jgi:hypothetical protein
VVFVEAHLGAGMIPQGESLHLGEVLCHKMVQMDRILGMVKADLLHLLKCGAHPEFAAQEEASMQRRDPSQEEEILLNGEGASHKAEECMGCTWIASRQKKKGEEKAPSVAICRQMFLDLVQKACRNDILFCHAFPLCRWHGVRVVVQPLSRGQDLHLHHLQK